MFHNMNELWGTFVLSIINTFYASAPKGARSIMFLGCLSVCKYIPDLINAI